MLSIDNYTMSADISRISLSQFKYDTSDFVVNTKAEKHAMKSKVPVDLFMGE